MREQLTARFQGRVQGVGFRATTADIAVNFAVVGHVRNMRDGSVELVAQGESEELARFLGEIRSRLSHNIVTLSDQWVRIHAMTYADFQVGPSQGV